MQTWLSYLKRGLSRKLPKDKYYHEENYGRLRDNIKYLFPSVKKHWKAGLLSFVSIAITSLLAYPLPMINKYLIDDVLIPKKLNLIIPVVLVIVSIQIGEYLFGLLKNYYQMRFSQEVILDIQNKLVEKVLSLPKYFFDTNRSGYLMSRINRDVQGVSFFISGTLVRLLMSFIKFIGGVGFLFYLDWRLALPIVLSLPLPFFSIRFFSRRSYIMSHHVSELNANSNAVLQETVSSVSLIKSFANEVRALKNISTIFKKRVDISYENQIVGFLSSSINQFFPSIAKLMVLIFGAYWVVDGQWELGTLLAYLSYLMYVYGPVNQLSSSINSLQSSRATLDRLATMFQLDSEINYDKGKEIDKLNGNIIFENVTFYYETDKPVINDLTFEIRSGDHIAIVGESGVGKTTLISLILRFYLPVRGNIHFDNIPVSEMNIKALRKRIGYVSQRIALESGTIMENLKYGNETATDQEIKEACKIANIHNYIETLDKKYNTALAEGGENLSEGQKQRIAIARALIKKPDILILDEPTSSLDNITEKSIYDILPEILKGKTVITIAHKLSTIKSSNKIILLRKNKKALIGNFRELEAEKDFIDLFGEKPKIKE
jgi:ABC-type bacteriocin/lantibiotic exporter with double-glycine peptidase domain